MITSNVFGGCGWTVEGKTERNMASLSDAHTLVSLISAAQFKKIWLCYFIVFSFYLLFVFLYSLLDLV